MILGSQAANFSQYSSADENRCSTNHDGFQKNTNGARNRDYFIFSHWLSEGFFPMIILVELGGFRIVNGVREVREVARYE